MSSIPDLCRHSVEGEIASVAGRRSIRASIGWPAAVFTLLATLFGLAAIFLIPPFRGADEPAHFLRAYGIAHGQIIPALADEHGRKGIYLPPRIHRDYEFFETVRYRFATPGFSYREVFAEYLHRKDAAPGPDASSTFVLYAGSEGYAPVVYLPYVPAVWLARALDLGFVPMLLLMRVFGFVAATALAACAIAFVPYFGWSFLFIAMLPIAMFERAIVCADGAALSFGMLVTAACLRAATGRAASRAAAWQRSLWMTLCALIKPSQVAFAALEIMTRPPGELLRQWRTSLLVIGPGLLLTILWLTAGSSDMGTWRMIEGTGEPAEHFSVAWKLRFLIDQPGHFLHAVLGSLANVYELWRESMGGLGWRDTHLSLPIYVLLSAMFLATSLVRLDVALSVRARIGVAAILTVLGYWAAIFLIFYLAWTPIQTEWIHGILGRYFTIILSPLALAIAALVNRGPPEAVTAFLALTGAIVSGGSALDAVVRSQW